MKFPLLFLLSGALFGFSPIVHAQLSPFSIRVEQTSKPEPSKDPKDKYTKTQKHSLRVSVTNGTHEEAAVKIKFTFYGHAVNSHDLITVEQGDQDATVKASGTQIVEIPPITVSYSEDHYLPKAKDKTPGTGNKVTGYGVQVYLGEKMVAESYEPPSLKEQAAKAPAAPAAAKPPAK